MAPKELKALLLLIDNPGGLFGSEFVNKSDGYIGRGTVYTLLERLVEKGFVDELEEPATSEYQLARTRHRINGKGQAAVIEYCSLMGLRLAGVPAG